MLCCFLSIVWLILKNTLIGYKLFYENIKKRPMRRNRSRKEEEENKITNKIHKETNSKDHILCKVSDGRTTSKL